jgi:hypothetical protein
METLEGILKLQLNEPAESGTYHYDLCDCDGSDGFAASDPLLEEWLKDIARHNQTQAARLCAARARLESLDGNPRRAALWFERAAEYIGDETLSIRYSKLAACLMHLPCFRLVLCPPRSIVVQENLFILLCVEVENVGFGIARNVGLSLSSTQMDITQPNHNFGDLPVGEKKTWDTLQIRPYIGGGLLLELTITCQDGFGEPHTLLYEQGLHVLQSEQCVQRVVNITIGENVSNSIIIAGDDTTIEQGKR